jgi:hypothetical protein
MADLTVDITAQAYTKRHNDFADIVSFWNPRLKLYFQLTSVQRQEWRDQDPFLDDIMRWHERIRDKKHEDL